MLCFTAPLFKTETVSTATTAAVVGISTGSVPVEKLESQVAGHGAAKNYIFAYTLALLFSYSLRQGQKVVALDLFHVEALCGLRFVLSLQFFLQFSSLSFEPVLAHSVLTAALS